MTIAKTLMLSALAVIALGVATAMANGPDGLNSDLRFARTPAAARNTSHASGVQSGSPSIFNHWFGTEGLGG